MTFAMKLKYAGSAPYQPEQNRRDIGLDEMTLLEQDRTYQRLAEVRWLANELELDLDRDEVPAEVADEMFGVVAERDAPLKKAVEKYVDHWLAEHREGAEE